MVSSSANVENPNSHISIDIPGEDASKFPEDNYLELNFDVNPHGTGARYIDVQEIGRVKL